MTNWAALPFDEWKETRDTLHMQLQVIGKVRLALSPFEPEWANVPLYLTGRGVTTSTIPHPTGEVFDIDADLVDHVVRVRTGAGAEEQVALHAPVASFYGELMAALARAHVPVEISTLPSEVPNPIRFEDDTTHATYDAEWVTRFWRVLLSVEAVLRAFRATFDGKTPPVQLWWGTLDLAVSLYTGRKVTPPADAGVIERLGGGSECFTAGFWPGNDTTQYPAFFAYRYPKPDGIERAPRWDEGLGELIVTYDEIRAAADPASALRRFLDESRALVAGG